MNRSGCTSMAVFADVAFRHKGRRRPTAGDYAARNPCCERTGPSGKPGYDRFPYKRFPASAKPKYYIAMKAVSNRISLLKAGHALVSAITKYDLLAVAEIVLHVREPVPAGPDDNPHR